MYGKTVKPGSKVSIESSRPAARSDQQERRQSPFRRIRARARRASGTALCRGHPRPAGHLPGHGHQRQGWGDRGVLPGCQSVRLPGRRLQVSRPSRNSRTTSSGASIRNAPARGQIVVFNRSHYEDVLVVRVHNLAPKAVWSERYDQINAFEKVLTDTNTIVLKFFLHISKEEQEERLLARERIRSRPGSSRLAIGRSGTTGTAYQKAYQDVLRKCSTDHAPWHVIPADQKWFRNLAISEIVVTELRRYKKDWDGQAQGPERDPATPRWPRPGRRGRSRQPSPRASRHSNG